MKLMSGSCHIRSVEIVVELGIFFFFFFSAEKNQIENNTITLIEL